MAFGLSESGLEIKRLADVREEIEDELRSQLGSAINLLPESVFGNLVGIFSEREALIWELIDDVYNSAYPDTAVGVSLDNVVALTGIRRLPATKSRQLSLRLFGNAGTNVPADTEVSVQGNPTAKFLTDNATLLVAGVDEEQQIAFDAVPDAGTWRLNWRGQDTTNLAFDATAAQVQTALTSLNFGDGIEVAGDYTAGFTVSFEGDAGKQEQPLIGVDFNTLTASAVPVVITISEIVAGVNQGVVDCTALEFGPTLAPAGTLTEIDTPVSGLNRVINMTDAIVGRNVETHEELRIRRARTLQVAGKATPDAIRSAMLAIEGVQDAIVFENDTLLVDSNGRPPKSYEVVVNGGDTQQIADTIWDTKPAGIATFGSQSETVLDSQGQTQTVNFSRPTEVEIYVEIDLTVDTSFPVNGIAAAQQAIVTRGNAFGIGANVIVSPKLICALDPIPGILSVVIRIGTSPSPTLSNNILIAANEIPVFDTSRVAVAVLP